MNKNPLVLGYGGLGKEIVKQTGWDYISRKKDKFDFKDFNSYVTKIYKYSTIINCIGFTDTYSANRDEAWNVNFVGVISLADYCAKTNRKLVHISTDYIYAGSQSNATEKDIPVHARNWYSYTKLLADGYVQAACKNYLIIRTSFKPKPFPYRMAITTQLGNFDYTDVIAKIIIELINKDALGVYNVGTERKTIYDLALETNKKAVPMNRALDVTMPTDITMDIRKTEEFLDEN